MSGNYQFIAGDQNIVLSDVNAGDINITLIGSTTDPVIKEKKKAISAKISDILRKLKSFSEKEQVPEPQNSWEQVDWDMILDAIETDSCVLFVGQDIAVDEQGNSLHEKFYKSISSEQIFYSEKEGLFLTGSVNRIKAKSLIYYQKRFSSENIIGNKILNIIVHIPFSLIISTSPDDTIHKIYELYNIDHQFIYYNETTLETDYPTKDLPVIFNFLGNSTQKGNFVITVEQLYDYLTHSRDVRMPKEVENKIRDSVHYIFLGMDFNKWYNRLLLYTLNLNRDTDALALLNKPVEDIYSDFLEKQFNITTINNDYLDFALALYHRAAGRGLTRSLRSTFVNKMIEILQDLANETIDSESAKELANIEKTLDSYLQKINQIL